MSVPERVGSRLVCCASTCCTACSSFGGSAAEVAAAPRLANSGAWLSCTVAAVCAAMVTAIFSSGVSTVFGGALVDGLSGASISASGDKVTASAEAPVSPPCPTLVRRMPLSVCDTASFSTWPSLSGISVRTSIERLAIAIRTRSACSTFSTVASTTLPGCNRSSGAIAPASWAGCTPRVGSMEIAMIAGLARLTRLAQRRKPLVNRTPDQPLRASRICVAARKSTSRAARR